MTVQQMMFFAVVLLLALGSFVLSWLQFKQKGFLLNNAYILASREERRAMDQNPESKRPHYRQSGVVLLLLGTAFLLYAGYMALELRFLLAGFWLAVIAALIYAVVSSVKDALHG